MQKQDAIDIFEGRQELADGIGITPQAISDWPDELPRRIADRVISAAVIHGKKIPAKLLEDLRSAA